MNIVCHCASPGCRLYGCARIRSTPPMKFVPTPLPPPVPLGPEQGWQCPVCGSVYAPFMVACLKCARPTEHAHANGPDA